MGHEYAVYCDSEYQRHSAAVYCDADSARSVIQSAGVHQTKFRHSSEGESEPARATAENGSPKKDGTVAQAHGPERPRSRRLVRLPRSHH